MQSSIQHSSIPLSMCDRVIFNVYYYYNCYRITIILLLFSFRTSEGVYDPILVHNKPNTIIILYDSYIYI